MIVRESSIEEELVPYVRDKRAVWRLVFPVLLFVCEAFCFRNSIHGTVKAGLGASFAFEWMLGWLLVFVFCGVLKFPRVFRELLAELVRFSVRLAPLIGHFVSLGLLILVTWIVLSIHHDFRQTILLAGVWYLALAAATACGALGFLPLPAIRKLFVRTRLLSLYAALVSGAAIWGLSAARINFVATTWLSSTKITFALVKLLLRPFVANVVTNSAAAHIGTDHFKVTIGYGCSGMEGVILILVFSAAWLCFFRSEMRFPRSLLLMPASMLVMFLLNAVRIALLILIGHAGARQVALGGFHSNAGWIFYVSVGISLVYATQSKWLRRDATRTGTPNIVVNSAAKPALPALAGAFAQENATAVYLAPLLVIVATGMITRVASAGFDWLYPLRFVTAATVIWIYRRKYLGLDWRFSGVSVILGAVVFLLWIAPFPASANSATTLGSTLEGLPRWGRTSWVIFRVLGATLTVPIAEELAFRGFALRRLQFPNFESVNWRTFTWSSLLISSVIFGVMHGERWIVGTAAGLVYAAAMLRRGRLGDAAVAHATTNALLAAWVITRGAWYLW